MATDARTGMLRAEKEQIVVELAERLREASGLILADYRGLSVPDLEELRGELIGLGARFTICKNRLTKLAAQQADVDAIDTFLTGPTAIAFVTDGDMAAVAKALQESAKKTQILTLKGGVLDGQVVDGDTVRALAALPPTDVLQSQMVGVIVAPLRDIVSLISAPMRELVGVIDARIRQLEEQGEGASPETADAPGETSETEPADAAEPGEAPDAPEDAGAPADGEAASDGNDEADEKKPDTDAPEPSDEASGDASDEAQAEQSEKEDETDGND